MEKELENFILGEKLGTGIHRDVYVLKTDESKVVKVARDNYDSRAVNLIEYRLYWDGIFETPLEKWFAKVFSVSECGKYLIQERTEPARKEEYPEKIPDFFTDTKYDNFGYIKGKGIVCVDYGCFNVFKNISSKMVKADWWE
jgi:hypothetical protein